MLPDGYRVLDQAGDEVWKGDKRSRLVDQLSVAAADNSPVLLLELADSTGSRIVAIPSGAPSSKDPEDPRPLIPDAESPAISPDGRSVAFIRETRGKGTLWIARLEHSLGRLESLPNQIADNAYDVRDVTFAPSGWILFAAKMNGRISILRMIPGGQPRMVSSPGEDVDSPAVSPDERLVAFRKLVHNRWQLGYMDVATGHESMLTFGDCNVYSPSWTNPVRIAYATDCGRGLGLSALASVGIGRVQASSIEKSPVPEDHGWPISRTSFVRDVGFHGAALTSFLPSLKTPSRNESFEGENVISHKRRAR
jgi:dipeptidyl aminopeptidase/acylaminoacyl peptidase